MKIFDIFQGNAAALKFAAVLDIDLATAENSLKGNGLYVSVVQKRQSKSGRAYISKTEIRHFEDTPRIRRRLLCDFGKVCVVRGGNVSALVKETREYMLPRDAKSEWAKQMRFEEEKRAERERQYLFRSGQTFPCPKRGGKGNGRGDIGRYNNFRAYTCAELYR